MTYIPRSQRNRKDIPGQDTFCYDCNLDTKNLECGPHSGCFLSRDKFLRLKQRLP
jgi:hypothetical protein